MWPLASADVVGRRRVASADAAQGGGSAGRGSGRGAVATRGVGGAREAELGRQTQALVDGAMSGAAVSRGPRERADGARLGRAMLREEEGEGVWSQSLGKGRTAGAAQCWPLEWQLLVIFRIFCARFSNPPAGVSPWQELRGPDVA